MDKRSKDMTSRETEGRKNEDLSGLSKWMASNPKFFVIRRFGVLNTRIILKLQAEICELEDTLSSLDRNPDNRGQSFPLTSLNDIEPRKILLDDLEGKLDRYNQYITTFSQVQALDQASAQQIETQRQWIRTYSKISRYETNFISEDQDLILLNTPYSTPFRVLLSSLAETYTRAEEISRGSGLRVHIYPDSFFERFEKWAIIGGGVVMLVAPLWCLLYIKNPAAQLGIITGFMLASAVFVWIITNAKASELLGAVTAYAAVLLVFQIHS